LVNNPDIIYADEPTGNLDSKSASDVMSLLVGLNEKQKKTIILVTHSPAYLEHAHRVFYMKDGTITNIKVNKALKDSQGREVVIGGDDKSKRQSDSGMDLLTKTYSSFRSKNLGNLLIPYKAKQIVAEALSGRTVEEVDEIEKRVQDILKGAVAGTDKLEEFFDQSFGEGGLAMNKRTAKSLACKIGQIIEELAVIQQEEKALKERAEPEISAEIRKIRHYLLDDLDINLRQIESVKRLNEVIGERLESHVDYAGVRVALDKPLVEGGVGLDRRVAGKIARRLELLMLGRY
jgi:ABC-type multidrug transport system ATPase subunit